MQGKNAGARKMQSKNARAATTKVNAPSKDCFPQHFEHFPLFLSVFGGCPCILCASPSLSFAQALSSCFCPSFLPHSPHSWLFLASSLCVSEVSAVFWAVTAEPVAPCYANTCDSPAKQYLELQRSGSNPQLPVEALRTHV